MLKNLPNGSFFLLFFWRVVRALDVLSEAFFLGGICKNKVFYKKYLIRNFFFKKVKCSDFILDCWLGQLNIWKKTPLSNIRIWNDINYKHTQIITQSLYTILIDDLILK